MARIYLSSTYADLIEYREAVYRTLRQMRHDVLSMEDYGATDQRPLEKCLSDVAASDLYVGIFAWRYGYRPPDQEKSITELEFREALRTHKPCLIFLLAEEAPWPRTLMDEADQSIKALRADLQREYVVAFFHTPDDLARAVSIGVINAWQERFSHDPQEGFAQDPSRILFYRDCLRRFTSELGTQIRFYSLSSRAILAFGLIILIVGLGMMKLTIALGGALLATCTLIPMAPLLSTRKKKVLLDGYASALQQEHPPMEALTAVRRFLDRQLAT